MLVSVPHAHVQTMPPKQRRAKAPPKFKAEEQPRLIQLPTEIMAVIIRMLPAYRILQLRLVCHMLYDRTSTADWSEVITLHLDDGTKISTSPNCPLIFDDAVASASDVKVGSAIRAHALGAGLPALRLLMPKAHVQRITKVPVDLWTALEEDHRHTVQIADHGQASLVSEPLGPAAHPDQWAVGMHAELECMRTRTLNGEVVELLEWKKAQRKWRVRSVVNVKSPDWTPWLTRTNEGTMDVSPKNLKWPPRRLLTPCERFFSRAGAARKAAFSVLERARTQELPSIRIDTLDKLVMLTKQSAQTLDICYWEI